MYNKHLTIDNGQLTFKKEQLFERVLNFGVRIIKLANKLPKTPAGFKLGSQVVASATSIGANTQEAQGASSKLDFINKMSISLKEAKETKFWLTLIERAGLLNTESINSELKESDELCAIYSTIVKRAKLNLSNAKSQMSNEDGQTLLELIVVVAVSVIVVGALVFAIIASLRNAQFAKNQAQATKLAQEGIEKVRSLRDRDEANKVRYNRGGGNQTSKFSDLWSINFGCPDNCYFRFVSNRLDGGNSTTFEELAAFRRQVLIEDQGDGTSQKKVTVIVRWTDFSGDHDSKLITILGAR